MSIIINKVEYYLRSVLEPDFHIEEIEYFEKCILLTISTPPDNPGSAPLSLKKLNEISKEFNDSEIYINSGHFIFRIIIQINNKKYHY